MKNINWGRVLLAGWLISLMGFLLTGCNNTKERIVSETSLGPNLGRSENDEVICFTSTRGAEGIAMWCYRKDQGPSCPAPGH